ncbi:MAG: PilN domain-containing protein [Oscillospiraceae bacterium]
MNNTVQLLPAEYKKRIADKKKFNKIIGVMTYVMLISLVIMAGSTGLSAIKKTQINLLENEKIALQGQINAYGKYEAIDQERKALQTKIDGAEATDSDLVDLIGSIAEVIPGGIWIENIAIAEKALTLSCAGNSYDDVSKTMETLCECRYISEVYCQGSTESSGVVRFTISAVVL